VVLVVIHPLDLL
jgi:hypothetical protein